MRRVHLEAVLFALRDALTERSAALSPVRNGGWGARLEARSPASRKLLKPAHTAVSAIRSGVVSAEASGQPEAAAGSMYMNSQTWPSRSWKLQPNIAP